MNTKLTETAAIYQKKTGRMLNIIETALIEVSANKLYNTQTISALIRKAAMNTYPFLTVKSVNSVVDIIASNTALTLSVDFNEEEIDRNIQSLLTGEVAE